jgi:hypothetical protein
MLALSARPSLRSSLSNVASVGITVHPSRSPDDSGRVGRPFADLLPYSSREFSNHASSITHHREFSPEAEARGVGRPRAVGDGLGFTLAIAVGVGEGVGLVVGVGVAVAVGASVGVGLGVAVGVAVDLAVGVAVGVKVAVGVTVGVTVGVGVAVGVGVGVPPGSLKAYTLLSVAT